MQIQQKVLLVRAFRQLQEGVLKGLELIDKAGGEEIDRPEDLAELSVHLEQVEAHVRTMRETFDDYAGANSLLGAVAREREENIYPFTIDSAEVVDVFVTRNGVKSRQGVTALVNGEKVGLPASIRAGDTLGGEVLDLDLEKEEP